MNFSNYEQESKAIGLGGNYYRLQQGDNKIKILTEPQHFGTHFIGKGIKSFACLGKECPKCQEGIRLDHKAMLYVIDRRDEQVRLAEFAWSIYTAIGKIASSEEYGFDGLPEFDITITKTGEGKETEYGVLPGRKATVVTSEQEEGFAKKEPVADIIAKKIAEAKASMAKSEFA